MCKVARALAATGQMDDARSEYVSVLRRNPSSVCAHSGLKHIDSVSACASGDNAVRAGDLPAARRHYKKAGTNSDCGATGVAMVKDVRRLCDLGQTYLGLDRSNDAATAFKAALEKSPGAACASKGLETAGPSSFTRTTNDVVDAIPRIAAALGIVAFLVFLALLPGHIPPVGRQLRRLPILRRFLGPRLTLEALDDAALGSGKVGSAIAGRIKEQLTRMHDEAISPEPDLDMGTARDEFAEVVAGTGNLRAAFNNFTDVSEQTKLIAALLNLVYAALPIPRLSVSGVVEPPGPVAAATLALEGGSRLEASTRLLAPAHGKGDAGPFDYISLAESGAVWTQYEVARVLSGGKVEPGAAKSNVLVWRALQCQLAGDSDGACILYAQAIRAYPRNWAARVNLAVTEARSMSFQVAIRHLAEAFYEIEEGGQRRGV
jgi:tetratricopeptide (TPR) repeat protein